MSSSSEPRGLTARVIWEPAWLNRPIMVEESKVVIRWKSTRGACKKVLISSSDTRIQSWSGLLEQVYHPGKMLHTRCAPFF